MATQERRHLLSSQDFSIRDNSGDEAEYQIEVHDVEEVPVSCSYRLLVIVCCTLSMTITYAAQASLSSAMVCMIEDRDVHQDFIFPENITDDNVTFFNLTTANTTYVRHSDWLFTWDKSKQGLAISAFFMGYYVSQIPSGIAAARFGAKRVVVVSLILVSIFQVLAVPSAYFGIGWLYADRVIVGIIDGFLYSPTFALAGQWAPRQETSLLFGIVGMGMELGNVLSYATSLLACEIVVQEGWPFVFYIMGALGLIIAALFMIIVSDSPFNNRRMSRKEVKFIASCIPKNQPTPEEALTHVPVKEILSSMCVWAIVVSQIGSDWLYYFYVTMEPTFLKDVIKLTHVEVNLLSGLPFLGIIPTIYLSGYICDKLVTKGVISNTKIRKINDFICKIIPSAMLIGLGFLPQESTAATFVMNLFGAMCMGFSYVSWMANPVDLAPAYTGFIVGICEIGAIWVAIVVPIIFDDITLDKTREEWQLVFYITAGIQVFCFLFYAFFASGELQPWAVSTSRNVYEDLDNQDNGNTPVVVDAVTSRPHSKVSARGNDLEDEETQNLLLSLSISLGDFRGTSSYEASVRRNREARTSHGNVGSNTVIISGPAITKTGLQSGHIEIDGMLGQHNLSNTTKTAIMGQIKSGQDRNGFYFANGALVIPKHIRSDVGLGVWAFENDRYIESDDDSWQNTATRSLPSNLIRSVSHGHGDIDIHSTLSSALTSGQYDNETYSEPPRNNKNLATEIAEALSIHSLNEPTKNNDNYKQTNYETNLIFEDLQRQSNVKESVNELFKGTTKKQDFLRKKSLLNKYLDSKKANGAKNLKQRRNSLNKKAPDKKRTDTNDPNLNRGNTSSIMLSSEDFPDSMNISFGEVKNENTQTSWNSIDKDPLKNKNKDPRQISGLFRNLFAFGRSKSNPQMNLPSEDTFVFVTDNDIKDATNIDSWTTKSFDSVRNMKQSLKRHQNLKNVREIKKRTVTTEEDDEHVLFAHPHEISNTGNN